jgi:undecaprenyl-diphosphatase
VTADAGKTNQGTSVLLLLAGLLLAAAAVCFFVVDERVLSYLRENPQKWDRTLWAQALKMLGRGYLLIWLLLVWVWLTGKHKTVIVCLLSLLITLAAVTVIKETVRRPRPRDVITAQTKGVDTKGIYKTWSFPSGDVASVFAAAAVLAFAMPWPATLAFAICCCGVAILRVVALAHYPSDVLGGAATGILSGWLAILITKQYPGIENILTKGIIKGIIIVVCLIVFRERCPEIENISEGKERILSFIGVILIPILIWRLQGLDKLIILLEFYVPIVLIMAIVDHRRQSKQTRTADITYIDETKGQGK